MALEDRQGPESVNCIAEVIMTNALAPDNGTLLLVDSGACVSTCPRAWCDWAPICQGELPHAVTATGAALK
eukprot:2863845-Heterocapsa_arctica.AAC.1